YTNALPGTIRAVADDRARVEVDVGGGVVIAGRWRAENPPRPGDEATVAFRGDRVALGPPGKAAANAFQGEVMAAAFLGTCIDYAVQAGPLQVKAEGSVAAPVARGVGVTVEIEPDNVHAFGPMSEPRAGTDQ